MYEVLAVDDDLMFLNMLRTHFNHSDFCLHIAQSAGEALELFFLHTFDCILLDIVLPDMNGYEICSRIRKKSDIPIIFLSNKEEESARIMAFEHDCDDYVCKPCSFKELELRILRRIQDKKNLIPKKHLTYGDLVIIPNNYFISYKGHTISLTTTEFDILLLLAQSPNRVFSKNDIFQHVWNMCHLNEVHTVQVHIATLRKKLNQACDGKEFIHTVWGKGYQFVY